MEIDLDNLVFNGLDEAEERNAERLDDADKKPGRLSPMTTAAMPARSEYRAPAMPVLFYELLSGPVNGRPGTGFIKMTARRTADANRPNHLIALFYR